MALSVYVQMALVYEQKKEQILHSPDFQIHTVFLQNGRIFQRPFTSFFEK